MNIFETLADAISTKNADSSYKAGYMKAIEDAKAEISKAIGDGQKDDILLQCQPDAFCCFSPVQIPESAFAKVFGVKGIDTVLLSGTVPATDASLRIGIQKGEYAGVSVDVTDRESYYNAVCLELPNLDYPRQAAARLYAGNTETETDSPIATVLYGRVRDENDNSNKIVYCDLDNATAISDKRLPGGDDDFSAETVEQLSKQKD